MATIVMIEPSTGNMDRYEIGGSAFRHTHSCTYGKPLTFTQKIIDQFRQMPDARYAVEPPPRPTNPPAGAGTVRIAA